MDIRKPILKEKNKLITVKWSPHRCPETYLQKVARSHNQVLTVAESGF